MVRNLVKRFLGDSIKGLLGAWSYRPRQLKRDLSATPGEIWREVRHRRRAEEQAEVFIDWEC